jgi:hypothetical protein
MIEYEGETLYNIAAGLGFIAHLLTNVLWLRLLLVMGACFYIATGIVLNHRFDGGLTRRIRTDQLSPRFYTSV